MMICKKNLKLTLFNFFKSENNPTKNIEVKNIKNKKLLKKNQKYRLLQKLKKLKMIITMKSLVILKLWIYQESKK